MGKRRRKAGKKSGSSAYTEEFTFSVEAGNTATVYVSTLGNRPPRSNFRPMWLECEFCAFVPGTEAIPSSYSPVGFQVALGFGTQVSQSGLYESITSRVRLASTTPQHVRIRTPRSYDWLAWNTASLTEIASLTAVCIGRPSGSTSSVFVRGVCRLKCAIQTEVIASTCPTYVESHGGGEHGEERRAAATQRMWSSDNDRALTPACSVDSVAIDLSFLDLS